MTVRIATLNCRNTTDRWSERAPLLVDQLVELRPDVIGLQEVRHFPSQAAWIARDVGVRTQAAHWLHTTYKTGHLWFWEGIAILTRLPILERGSLTLEGDNRVANCVRVQLPGGGALDFYNTHLGASRAAHRAQAQRVLDWMASRAGVPQVLVGDFNVTPRNPIYQLVSESLRSAYATVHGEEPERTVPTPLRRPGPVASRGLTLDYLFVSPGVHVESAWLTFDRSAPGDPHLYASDHYGLAADISTEGPVLS